jgi:hypothetical protein
MTHRAKKALQGWRHTPVLRVSSDPSDVESVTLTLLCEVNPLLLTLAAASLGAHEATAIWDVRAAVDGGREVPPAEQHIHSFLESLPFMAVSALLCLHWSRSNGPGGTTLPTTGPGGCGCGGRGCPAVT